MRGVVRPEAIRERGAVLITILVLVTCGIYGFVWKFQTTSELREATGDESLNPVTDLLLSLVTCGLWSIYTDYRNAQITYELLSRCGVQRENKAILVLILDLVGLYVISPYLIQEELNAASRARALGF